MSFGDFAIARDATKKCLRDAFLVVGHYSLTFLDAAMLNLPILVLDISETVSREIQRETTAISSLLRVSQFRVGN